MTSEISFTSKLIHKQEQSLLEYFNTNDTLPNRLLSPITENSVEIPSTSLSLNKTCSDTSQKLPNIVLTNDNSSIDELNHILLQKFHHYITNFHDIQIYLDTLQQHFKALSIIMEYLRMDKNFITTIEPIETRLIQMRAKRDQIDHLLNQSAIKTIMQQISPFLLKSKSIIDYNEFLTSIQLSMNQKSTLIDHLKNEYRYTKYQLKGYSSKVKQRHELLITLINQIKQFVAKQSNHISIINEHNRQCIELTDLLNEYEQLQNENYFLTLKAKENIRQFSMPM